jgi:hypothetical protein
MDVVQPFIMLRFGPSPTGHQGQKGDANRELVSVSRLATGNRSRLVTYRVAVGNKVLVRFCINLQDCADDRCGRDDCRWRDNPKSWHPCTNNAENSADFL